MLTIPCVIFAGGKSSRMGEDKALLPFASYSTLTEFQYIRLSKIFSQVFISCKSKEKFSFKANFIEDAKESTQFAPTAGFIAALLGLESDTIFVISVDTPFIDEYTIKTILEKDSKKNDATIAILGTKIQPLCGVYHSSLLSSFLKMQEQKQHKLTQMLKQSNSHFIPFSNSDIFLNLNTPEEYQKALELLPN